MLLPLLQISLQLWKVSSSLGKAADQYYIIIITEIVKIELKLSDIKLNIKQEHMSTCIAEVKEEHMDHDSFKPISIVNNIATSVKCEMKKELTKDISQSLVIIMPYHIQFLEHGLKTETTDVNQSSYMKSETQSPVNERVKQEIMDSALFDTTSATNQCIPIKEEHNNLKTEPNIDSG